MLEHAGHSGHAVLPPNLAKDCYPAADLRAALKQASPLRLTILVVLLGLFLPTLWHPRCWAVPSRLGDVSVLPRNLPSSLEMCPSCCGSYQLPQLAFAAKLLCKRLLLHRYCFCARAPVLPRCGFTGRTSAARPHCLFRWHQGCQSDPTGTSAALPLSLLSKHCCCSGLPRTPRLSGSGYTA